MAERISCEDGDIGHLLATGTGGALEVGLQETLSGASRQIL